MLQYKMYPAGELRCPTTALVIICTHVYVISLRENGYLISLRKHAYSNILKILQPKKENKNQIKDSNIFFIFLVKNRLWVLVRTASVRRF